MQLSKLGFCVGGWSAQHQKLGFLRCFFIIIELEKVMNREKMAFCQTVFVSSLVETRVVERVRVLVDLGNRIGN